MIRANCCWWYLNDLGSFRFYLPLPLVSLLRRSFLLLLRIFLVFFILTKTYFPFVIIGVSKFADRVKLTMNLLTGPDRLALRVYPET